MKRIAPVLALLTATLAFAAPANAAADTTVQADLNGDGQLDRVAVSPVPGNPSEQNLTVKIGRLAMKTRVPLSAEGGVQPLRVVDVNNDGRDEILVTQSVGANTDTFSVWGMFDSLRAVVRDDGTRLHLWEGGAVSSVSRYGCEVAGDGNRQLVSVWGASKDVNSDYLKGERVTFTVLANGVATIRSRAWVEGFRDSAAFMTDPQACA
jgi:hypothetical protein